MNRIIFFISTILFFTGFSAELAASVTHVNLSEKNDWQVVDASVYGFSPSNSPDANRIALQAALDGGQKQVAVSSPGTYSIKGTVWIDDNTELVFADGVLLSLTSDTWNVFCNRGAPTRTWNTNIKISGLKIKTNGSSASPTWDSPLYGLNGVVNFYCIQNSEFDIEILDLARNNFGMQLVRFKDCIINNLRLEGKKDGLHLGPGNGLLIKKLHTRTYDDALALNAFDWAISNPEVGDIENVVVEEFLCSWDPSSGNTSRAVNVLMGAVGPWRQAMPVVNGDAVIWNGRTYRSILSDVTATVSSVTPPSITSYSGFQETPEGIIWKMISSAEIKTAAIRGIRISNMTHIDGYTADAAGISTHQIAVIHAGTEQEGNKIWSRSIHPDIPAELYPVAQLEFKNLKSSRGFFVMYEKDGYELKLDGFSGKIDNGFLIYTPTFVSKPGKLEILNSNLNGIAENGLNIKSGQDCRIFDNLRAGLLGGNFTGSRLNTDANMSIDPYSLAALEGDRIVSQGKQLLFTSGRWVQVALSTNETSGEDKLSLAPNPVVSDRAIFSRSVTYKLYDAQGRLLRTEDKTEEFKKQGLKSGVYTVMPDNGKPIRVIIP